MVERWRIARLKKLVGESIARDYTQPGGWHEWLGDAPTFEALVSGCTEPGWLAHLAFWHEAPPETLLRGALAAADVAAQALGQEVFPLRCSDWSVVLAWADTSEEERQRIAADAEPRFSDDLDEAQVGREQLRLALWLLVMATLHRDAGKRELLADAVAKGVAGLAAAAPERRPEMVKAMRERLGW